MAKQSGLGDNYYVNGVDLSGDTNSLSRVGGGPGAGDFTGINKSAPERLGLLRDGEISWVSYFNPATGAAHPTLRSVGDADSVVSYFRGTSLGSPVAAGLFKRVNYDGNRGQDGSFLLNVQALENGYGVDWGVAGTAGRRTDTAATNGTGVDLGAATSFGLQAFLHVFSFTGTSVTVKLQGSSDNGSGDAFADITGGGFTAATGVTSQRIATGAQAIERYVRVVTTGTFSSAVFAVSVHPNTTATTF